MTRVGDPPIDWCKAQEQYKMTSTCCHNTICSSTSGHTICAKIPNPFNEFLFDANAAEEPPCSGPLFHIKGSSTLVVVLATVSDALRPAYLDDLLGPKQREVYEVMVRSSKTLSADEFMSLFVKDREFGVDAAILIAMLFTREEPEFWKTMTKGERGNRLKVCLAFKQAHKDFGVYQKSKKIKRFDMVFSAGSFYLRGIIAKEVAPDCGDPE